MRKDRILLVGFLPQQASRLQSEFGRFFDLRVHPKDENPKDLQVRVEGAILALVLPHFLDRAEERALKRAGTPVSWVQGGLSSVRHRLTELSREQQR